MNIQSKYIHSNHLSIQELNSKERQTALVAQVRLYIENNQIKQEIKMKQVAGVYILSFGNHIKIGRSKNIYARVSQYNGYMDQDYVKKLLFVFTNEHHILEKKSHEFASQLLTRKGRYEKFICPTQEEKQKFIEQYKLFIQQYYKDIVSNVIDTFEEDQFVQNIQPMKLSNIVTKPLVSKDKQSQMGLKLPILPQKLENQKISNETDLKQDENNKFNDSIEFLNKITQTYKNDIKITIYEKPSQTYDFFEKYKFQKQY